MFRNYSTLTGHCLAYRWLSALRAARVNPVQSLRSE